MTAERKDQEEFRDMEVELELILQDAEVTVAKIREELAQHRQLRRQR